ncbi:MAG: amidohydrolase family protein [Acidimicrobiia bacterium]
MMILIKNIGELFTGDIAAPTSAATSIRIVGGQIEAVGDDLETGDEDRVIDAAGRAVCPGLVDGHVHPTFGEWTPAQNATGWIGNYLHGGVTTMISAGELHIPGLDFANLTPELVTSIAVVSAHTTGRVRQSGVRVHAGTVLLVPGMHTEHFDRLADAGCRFAKFIFYPFAADAGGDDEALAYLEQCRRRGIRVKTHTGGVSRSGASRPVGADVLTRIEPDIAAHVSGGPIPMLDDDLRRAIAETSCALEVCSSMNYRSTTLVVDQLAGRDELHRLTLGTDTPGGTGVIPRGMLRNVLLLAGVCGLEPATALAVATGNTARAHGLDTGVIEVGRPADLVVMGPVTGSTGSTVSDAIAHGDLPGISHVITDGVVLVDGRSHQTPPPIQPTVSCCDAASA